MLTKNFTLEELTYSDIAERQGLNNSAPFDIESNLLRLCEELLEPVRELLGKPLLVSSGYRSPEVNGAAGGSSSSEHMDGRASDFRVPHMTPYAVCRKLENSELPFNQLIHEFGRWTHISIPKLGEKPKREVLTARLLNGKVVYIPGIVPV